MSDKPVGVNKMQISQSAYSMTLRLLAENLSLRRTQGEVQDAHPDEEITFGMIRRIHVTRKDEVRALRRKLNEALDDLWIANRRQRLIGLQQIYEDANRWVPDHLLTSNAPGVPAVVVYKKNVDAMLKALKQAREEVGGTPQEKQADALERLAALAERERGLERTIDVNEVPDFDTVPELRDAELIEYPGVVRTKGASKMKGFLSGDEAEANAAATHLLPLLTRTASDGDESSSDEVSDDATDVPSDLE